GNGIGHGYIHCKIILQTPIGHVSLCDKTNSPYIGVVYVCQHRFVKFFLFTGKCFKKIPDRRIDILHTGCLFEPFVKQAEYPGLNKEGAEVTNKNYRNDNNHKSQSVVFYFITDRASVKILNGLTKNGEPAVNCGNNPIDRIDRYSNRSNHE